MEEARINTVVCLPSLGLWKKLEKTKGWNKKKTSLMAELNLKCPEQVEILMYEK